MRRFLTSLLFFTLAISLLSTEAPLLAGQRVLVLGDSITQDGRYVSFLEYYLLAGGLAVDLISIGLASETVSGLSETDHPFPRPHALERLDRALQAVKPTVVLACYGMNDGIYHPPSAERLAAFNTGLRELITKVRASGAHLVLLTPPVFDSRPIAGKTVPATAEKFGFITPYTGYDEVLAEFAAAEVALQESGVTVIDVHAVMTETLVAIRRDEPAFGFAPDGIHPGDAGHLLMARIIAGGLGLTGTAADPTTTPVYTLIHERRSLRSEAWLPFVGYTRGPTFKSESVKAAEAAAARLQREILTLLNR
jgi:lysophospholipase L1-like esterase